jgi:hypothetical protein
MAQIRQRFMEKKAVNTLFWILDWEKACHHRVIVTFMAKETSSSRTMKMKQTTRIINRGGRSGHGGHWFLFVFLCIAHCEFVEFLL